MSNSAGKLDGKIAVVTGGATGIGRAMAQRYANEGARVAIADINIEEAGKAAEAIGKGAKAFALDVTRQDSIDSMVANIARDMGPISVLVNNAAVFNLAPIADITRDQYRLVFSVNVEGLIFTLQAVAKHMVASNTRGKIINMASQAGRRGEPLVGVYCASKAAVISLTQSAGLDLIRNGINVNAISPGVVDTAMWDTVDAMFAKYEGLKPGEKKIQVGKAVPFGRMGVPEDLVGAAVFLASDDSDYIVAQTLNVDGGNWMN